jgi:hypothetical protein
MSLIRFFVGAVLIYLTGCRQQGTEPTNVWQNPQEVAKSWDSLSTSFSLYKWNGSLMTVGGDDGTFATRVLEDDGTQWRTISTVDPGWIPMNADSIPMDADPKQNRFVIARATIWSNRLDANFSVGQLSPDGRLTTRTAAALSLAKVTLFPNAQPNLEMNESGRPAQARFADGVMEGIEIRIPHSIDAAPIERRGHQDGSRSDLAVSANGVFASSDGGSTWRVEPISVHYSESPVMCRTSGFYYYFAKGNGGGVYELWYSRCATDTSSWSPPETINKSVARKLSERLHAVAENDTVHLCWLDARNEKTQFSLTRPRVGNYEVAYSRRSDSESSWSKDVTLSKGLRWAYAPSISVEGNNVVVAWAGAKADKEGRNEWNATDVYYVVSKDGGNSWTKPIQVTDGFKSGITSGRPQVALHKDVIHLFYIQGKTTYKEVSAGMVKLNQPPWPIYYQQRPFPE